uniref:Uncharacterized protein n=1 Tax=Nelumbo nucifera TaxID=4432 RepID=A0A822ZTV2_NELNU|nr:TPA_asm: hypothetical protein HUJ06_004536 [Nelumbo nucifera]
MTVHLQLQGKRRNGGNRRNKGHNVYDLYHMDLSSKDKVGKR